MKRNSYYPTNVGDQVLWLVNAIHKMGGYATELAITPEVLAAFVADCRWVVYVLESWQPATKAWGIACTEAVKNAQLGEGEAVMVLPTFTPPALPTGVAPVKIGALNRIFAFVQTIKDSGRLRDETAADLMFVGAEVATPDLDVQQPKFKVKLTADGVFLDWTWDGLRDFVEMIEFEVDRDGTGWKFLATDTTPGYTDTCPIPATPAKWKYRAIWRSNDKRVGLFSAVVSINVGG